MRPEDFNPIIFDQLKSIINEQGLTSGELFIDIYDSVSASYLKVRSRKRAYISRALTDFLRDNNIPYTINS